MLSGFVGDTAATIPVGVVNDDVQRLLGVTEEALYRGIENAREGNRLAEVCAAIQDEVESNGFSVVRSLSGMEWVAIFMKNRKSQIIAPPGRRPN